MFLRQSTASQEILLGPFVDSTDGNTAETALTISNTDINLFKEGATTLATKNSGGATHISGGYYYAVLDATDTNTVGQLEVHVKVSGALAIKREYQVVEEAIYDAVYAASANGMTATHKNWLGAIAGKTADTTTRAEINATTAGATYNETTDSQEANRDNVGTAGAGLTSVLAYLTSGTIELNNPHLDEETLALRNGRYYGSTGSTPPTWTVAKNYATATSVVLIIHKKDDVSVKYKTITATVSSATLITVTDFMMGSYTNTFSFDEESVPQVFECRYDLVASWGGNYESIDAGSCFIYDQPTP